MRGPTSLTPQQAQQAIQSRLKPLPEESLALAQALGRTLRQDVYAERDNPPFDRVCMDGIAIDSATFARGVRRYRLGRTQAAGAPPLTLGEDEDAIEVMTGAILPHGTDSIIPLEEYDLADAIVTLRAEAGGGAFRNVQRRGCDSDRQVPMLRVGARLGAAEIAVAASAGLPRLRVSRQPRFVVISTGDELIEPGEPILEHQVRRSNSYAIAAALQSHGFAQVTSDHIADDEAALRERLARHLAQHDVLVLSGGVSKGKFDLVPRVLKQLAVEEVFHQIAQRPGMPMWFGVADAGQAVFGLPGNPVSTLICLVRYVIPAITHAMGAPPGGPEPIALGASGKFGRGVTHFMPVNVQYDALGQRAARPRPPNGSGDFLALAGTDGFIELPPRADPFPQGFVAPLYRW